MSTQPQSNATFQSASLYVGDLVTDVAEGALFELFNRVGPVASIRVCRDAVTRRSLGYAYVNFHNAQDAERALDTMNFTEISAAPGDVNSKGQPCRIMWSQRDPSVRKSGVGNIFIKNLAPSVDNKSLFDTFSVFGNILSCKVVTDANGVSKGYGYVHYETAAAAQDSIDKLNGNIIEDQEVAVLPFVRRNERSDPAKKQNWTNVYVKQFPLTWTEANLSELFSAHGEIVSVWISRDAEGRSKGFAFINFADHASAEAAVAALHGKNMEEFGNEPGLTLYASTAQKKGDRVREIKSKIDSKKEEMQSRTQGLNLYVKNLDESITDDYFREIFAKYGTITSSRVMRDSDGNSKGFGFVSFASVDEATAAINDQNGKILRSKPLTVTLHQTKEVRQAQLASQYASRNNRFPQPGPVMPYGLPMYAQGPGVYPQPRPAFGFPQQQYAPRGGNGNPRGMPFNNRPQGGPVPGYYPAPFNPMMAQQQQPGQFRRPPQGQMMGGPAQPRQAPVRPMAAGPPRGGLVPAARYPQQGFGGGPMPYPLQQPGYGMPQQQLRGPNVKFNPNARNQQQLMMAPQAMAASVPAMYAEPLDDQILAQAEPGQQKNMIGERLYPLIYARQPDLAGKITGMLLEMDNAELINLLESDEALDHKINEALIVLKNHQSTNE